MEDYLPGIAINNPIESIHVNLNLFFIYRKDSYTVGSFTLSFTQWKRDDLINDSEGHFDLIARE